MVTYKGISRFFSRNNAGKYRLDVSEIRSAFALSGALPERMKRFRDDRLGKIVANEGPVPLESNPKMVLHILPSASFSTDFLLSPSAMQNAKGKLLPIGGYGDRGRFNIDGFLNSSHSSGTACFYCQTFRNGVIESVDATAFTEREGRKWLVSLTYEEELIQAVKSYIEALHDLEVPLPAALMLAFLGAKDCHLAVNRRLGLREPTPIDRDVLILPDVLVEDYDTDVPRLLRPIFDAVWNAAGWERSLNYDDNGNWNPK